MATVQHALTRGLEIVFQLEEGEVLSEPTPSRDNRRAILLYEATEGGAGVLNRLISEPDRVARIARAALDLMHLESIDAAAEAANPDLLRDKDGTECVKGCYRCLLSYYNQPDQELIDRTNVEARRVLLRLACSRVERQGVPEQTTSGWADALARWGLRAADAEPLLVDGVALPLVWRDYLVAGLTVPVSESARSAILARGFSIVDLPSEPGDAAPRDLVSLLKG